MAEDRGSRGALSMFSKKKKKKKKEKRSNTPDPGPNTLENEHHRSEKPSSPFTKKPAYENSAGFLSVPPQTPTIVLSVRPLESPISPRNSGPSLHPALHPATRPTYPTPETLSSLLLLPAEIRNSIYTYIIGTPIIRLHTETIATSLTKTGVEHEWEELSLNPNYRWEYPEPPRNTLSWLYHSGHSLRNVTRLWRTCKQIFLESYALSLSRMVFSFGNHLVAQDFLSHKLSDGIYPSTYVQTLLSTTLSQLQLIPTEDLRKFIGLKKVVVQCAEKPAWEWDLWDEMPKQKRDAERDKEKQAVREIVYDILRDAFPDRHIDIQRDVGIPLVGGLGEERLMLEWDGGKTI